MEHLKYVIRTMRKGDIPAILDLYREQNWLDGYFNLTLWSQFDPEGFVVAESNTDGIVGSCIGICHSEKLATVGGYIVQKDHRGKGIGKKLWAECMNHIEDRNAIINGEGDAWKMYCDSGDFPIIEKEWRFLMQHTDKEISSENLSSFLPDEVTIRSYSDSDLESMSSYDSSILGFDRKSVLKQLFSSATTFAAYEKHFCVGYGCIQPNLYGGSFVAPLYADDPMVAEALLKKLIDSSPDKHGLDISIISSNESCQDILDKLNCSFEVSECVRLYRKEKYLANLNSLYGLVIDISPF